MGTARRERGSAPTQDVASATALEPSGADGRFYVILASAIVTGRITRLIENQQIGVIAGEDGNEYVFKSVALSFGTFGALSLGAKVMFEPITALKGRLRASAVRLVTK